jgi:hypothetical protein
VLVFRHVVADVSGGLASKQGEGLRIGTVRFPPRGVRKRAASTVKGRHHRDTEVTEF